MRKTMSQAIGKFCNSESIPKVILHPMIRSFAYFYNAKAEDMVDSFDSFNSFQQFFTRKVKPRNIAYDDKTLLSPADSELIALSKIEGNNVMLVKGNDYLLSEMLEGPKKLELSDAELQKLKKNADSELYSAIFYLRPGDYHRYHSPSDFTVSNVKHITGDLKTVNKDFIFKFKVN
jgi:phosphatidylserine decarboxylase